MHTKTLTLPWFNTDKDSPAAPPVGLGFWPTPLHPLKRLSEELGGPTIWLKRDDCSGLATGGNKTRKLEYLLGEALRRGADTIVTFGAVQSNHARQTAAACAQLGLDCHVILSRRVPSRAPNYESGGNVLLNRFLGAKVHILDNDDVDEFTQAHLAQLSSEGRTTYSIPPGGSNAVGALGYAQCALELNAQLEDTGIQANKIFHASASCGTQAGLIYGCGYASHPLQVCGINVFHPDPTTLERRVRDVLNKMVESFGQPPNLPEIEVNHAYFGEGYGLPTPETLEALHMAAELEGVLFDPVYSGKALCALLDQINLGNLADSDNVILIHTGGSVALNVYEQDLLGS